MNSIGVVVKRIHKNPGKQGVAKTEIYVEDLPNGLYYVVVKSSTKLYTKNFLKIK